MSDLDPGEQNLLDSLREADEPTDADRERVRSAVLAKIALASGAATAAATTAKGAAGAVTSAGAVVKSASSGTLIAAHGKAVVAVVALAGLGAGTWWVMQEGPAQAPVPPTMQATAASVPGAPASPVASEAAAEPRTPRQKVEQSRSKETNPAVASPTRSPSAARPRPRPGAKDLDQEMRLIGAAQQAMQKGDPDLALQLLDEHASDHPSGVLTEERAGARAIALCKAGRTSEGQTAAKRFLAKSPRSPLAARIRAACLGKTQ